MNRNRIRWFLWMGIGIFSLAAVKFCDGQDLQKFSFTRPKMGSPFTIILYSSDSAKAWKASDMAFSLVDSLNQMFSDYLESSELNRLGKTAGSDQWIDVSPALFEILSMSKNASVLSNGYFDITSGPVVRLWRQARREHLFPDKSVLKRQLRSVGYTNLLLDASTRRVKLLKPGMLLDLGGIAKGFVAQAVVDKLRALGMPNSLADAGGDIVVGAPPPGKKGWTLGINAPESKEQLLEEFLSVSDCSVSSSGDVYQYVLLNGKKYSHIIDPKTGIGSTFQRNVTVIARSGAESDWLATACSLLSIRKAMRLISRTPGAEVLIAELYHGKIKVHKSRGLDRYKLLPEFR